VLLCISVKKKEKYMQGTIILIDAYAQIYRGFYALPLMSNSQGEYTNAVFAFSRFLLSLEKYHSPLYGAVVFDLGKPTARLEILPEYKANRSPMPDELRSQLPVIREVVEAFGYPLLESEGREADDLLVAIAAYFADFNVKIISADKDIAQVIDERVEMLIPGGKNRGLEKRGVDEVIAKFAVRPEQIVDYLAMIGDASDNIIGVAGVGPKTAAKLIAQFSSIEAMLANTDAIENLKLREKIANAAGLLRKNIQLIQLDYSFPDETWKEKKTISKTAPDWDKVAKIAEKMELKSFIKDLEEFRPPPSLFDVNRDTQELVEEEKTSPEKETQPSLFTPDLFG
jgi:5'-3' exonuclease